MRVISLRALKAFCAKHADAERPLKAWYRSVLAARWRRFADVRQTFSSADTAKVRSGNTVTIFDIAGNKYRLIAAVHYNTGCLYVLRVLTHGDYGREDWKGQL